MYKLEVSPLKHSHRHTSVSLPAVICFLFPLAFGVSRAGHAGLHLGSTGIVRDVLTVTVTFLWSPMSPAW